MGQRSKVDLNDLLDRVIEMHDKEKLTHAQIADILKAEGYSLSRESIRRAYKTATEHAKDLRIVAEEARILLDEYKAGPNTDMAEAVLLKFTGLMYNELQEIESIEFTDPGEAVLAIGRLANAQAKLGSVRMKYQNGFDAARKAVLDALKRELKSEHPDILDRLTMIVGGLEAPAA